MSQAQGKGFSCLSTPVKVTLVSPQTIEKVPPPRRGCRMLKSVGGSSLTTSGQTRTRDKLLPFVESKTGHIPAFSIPDQSAPSITGRVPQAKDEIGRASCRETV